MQENPTDIFDEMDEMFARLFTRMDREFMNGTGEYGYRVVFEHGGDAPGIAETEAPRPRDDTGPVTEIHQIGDEVKVIAELPGVTEEFLRLDIRGDQLIIDAGDAGYHYHTSAALPPVDASSLHASIKNGVLEVTFRSLTAASAEP